ncbi:Hypothetical Protein FCC1311_008822 [Hondaea fermentalgiana]|uniref:Major facilitator superfamily (MFS) profile domain-containing protein n=1 Tax=Hondaea fermentalgiana TaxID=2315210 RepID=A0A2R5GAD3_9STRA|nr:Hypothetical Protein FCC1311_008822 [Hondaea fermentalgiana]|eukprot:GBG24664.1 Hypothetical Protein FCC1311_008822 [Hondaea fermentalgiana]
MSFFKEVQGLRAWKNPNVRAALMYTATYSFALGLWGTSVLSGYLKTIPPGKNTLVGIAEGLQGAVQAMAALPSGYMGDKYGRERVLRVASGVGVLTVCVFIVTLAVGASYDNVPDSGVIEYVLMCIALGMFGFFDGSSSGSLEALFHDSLHTEERPVVTTAKFIARVLFRATGPCLSAVLFVLIGDTWTRPQLRTVFYVGIGLTLIPAMLLLLLRDKHALGHESEAVPQSPEFGVPDASDLTYAAIPTAEIEAEQHALAESRDHALSDGDEPVRNIEAADADAPLLRQESAGSSTAASLRGAKFWIPRITLACDVSFGLASGMTIKFFPLFFKEETGMSPGQVNAIYVISPLAIVVCSVIATRMIKYFGRVRVPIFFSTSGVILLFAMYQMGQSKDKALWKEPMVIVPIFIVRTAFMNCCAPIRKSILIDFVDKSSRAWWNSMDSVSQFSWSGSAVLGGILCDKYGYGASFLATAIVQFIAVCVFSMLLFYRERIDGVGQVRPQTS